MRFLSRQSPEQLEPLFERQRAGDRLGHTLHTWGAVVMLVALTGPTTATEAALVPALAIFVIRLPGIWRLVLGTAGAWVVRVFVAFGLWWALTLAWSPDRGAGIEEVGTVRFALALALLWPVLDRRRLLTWALAAGLLAGNVSQVLHAIGTHTGVHALTWPRMPDRNSGWWDPVVGGSLLCAALGLHLPGAVAGMGRERLAHAACALVTLAAIFASGTRGAWIAAAALLVLVGSIALWTRRHEARRALRSPVVLAIAGGAVLLAVGIGAVIGPGVARRAAHGYSEVAAAVREGRYQSDTGARLLLAGWAVRATGEHPAGGVGAGGFRAWVRDHLRAQGVDPDTRAVHAHAHNALLHASATTGVPGAALLIGLVVTGMLAGRPRPGESWGRDAGPCVALLGLALVSAFDTVQVNAQTAALLFTLLALCNDLRPRPTSAM